MLEHIRKLFGYTQEELASKIGVTQNYYTQIETGSSRSAPLISKISKELKIKESFLSSSGEYIDYPFLDNFYIFYLPERRIVQSYKFFLDYICSPSDYVDIVFFFTRPTHYRMPLFSSIIYIALRDDHDTVFLLKRPTRTMFSTIDKEGMKAMSFSVSGRRIAKQGETVVRDAKQDIKTTFFSLVDIFREDLHKLQTTYVYEKTVRIGDDFIAAVDRGEIKRDNILPYFPTNEYIRRLCESRRKN